MKKSLIIFSTILICFSCSLFQNDEKDNKIPSGWTEVEELNGGLVKTFFTDDNHIFAGKEAEGIAFSDNNAKNWENINVGIDESDPEFNPTLDRRAINAFVKINGELFVGLETAVSVGNYEGKDYEFIGGIYKYIENSKEWEYVGFKELDILDVAVINKNLLVGTRDGLYLIENDEGNWTKTNIGLDGYHINTIAVIDSTIFIESGWSLLKSSDFGINWIDIHTGLTADHYNNSIYSVGNRLFLGTNNGIYISDDSGGSWIEKNSGIPYDSMAGYSTISQINHTDSTIIAIYLLDTFYDDDDFPTRISTGIVYTKIDDLNWDTVEFTGDDYNYSNYFEPFAIGIIGENILISLIKTGTVGGTNHKVWINSKILN